MTTVYRKSAKGLHEIETRANRLAPRLRTALILVDGRRTDAELRNLIQAEPDATLLALLEAGYIEVVASAPGAPAAPVSLSRGPGPVPAAAPAAADAAAFAARQRGAVRHLTDQLGPLAEAAALRIEKARSWDELRPALEFGQRLLQTARGGAVAAQFAAQFIDGPG